MTFLTSGDFSKCPLNKKEQISRDFNLFFSTHFAPEVQTLRKYTYRYLLPFYMVFVQAWTARKETLQEPFADAAVRVHTVNDSLRKRLYKNIPLVGSPVFYRLKYMLYGISTRLTPTCHVKNLKFTYLHGYRCMLCLLRFRLS